MPYLLDTNVCITFIKSKSPQLTAKFASVALSDIYVCSVVRAELMYGVEKSNLQSINLLRTSNFLKPYASVPLDDRAAEIFAKERYRLESIGQSIGPYDLMIAAIALANGLVLVTHNVREFSRIQGLQIEDWEV